MAHARTPRFSFPMKKIDVIVIGAGAAGLTAAIDLGSAGLSVLLLEARDRIGGRMFTVHDSECNTPVELGAEFIHGRPPEIWNFLSSCKIKPTEVSGDSWCAREGKLSKCSFFSEVDDILEKMSVRGPDQSFSKFLDKCCGELQNDARLKEARQRATSYVSGFNAADPAIVGVHWLVKGMRAEEQIQGDRAFRALNGYSDLAAILLQQIENAGVSLLSNTIVESIHWRRGHAEITTRGSDGLQALSASRVLITVPLGVLQAAPGESGAIRFIPELPRQKQAAIANIMMGKVIRVTLRFRERFWESLPRSSGKHSKTMDGMSFLFSQDDWFPTWWTMYPRKLPFLTGWAPFHCAERLSGQSESFVIERSLRSLHRLLGLRVQELETLFQQIYTHDWQNDPFSRGAYSYGKVGQEKAPEALAVPVRNTLFFAGEATDMGGRNGTVHAAIASGKRAAAEIIRALGSRKPGTPASAARRKATRK
jgi:monoamine oxidase